ncbi:MAG: hypothetical protein E2O29_01705 [Deltaproteobacteria bacterium]|nr:MAG: hypothetical protein E2O29_01705 [Deltaproteobacteria bacterium]
MNPKRQYLLSGLMIDSTQITETFGCSHDAKERFRTLITEGAYALFITTRTWKTKQKYKDNTTDYYHITESNNNPVKKTGKEDELNDLVEYERSVIEDDYSSIDSDNIYLEKYGRKYGVNDETLDT